MPDLDWRLVYNILNSIRLIQTKYGKILSSRDQVPGTGRHVVPATVQRTIDKLVKLEILSFEGDTKRNRVYCTKERLKILEEPANFVAMMK